MEQPTFQTPYDGALTSIETQLRFAQQEEFRLKQRIEDMRRRREDIYLRRADCDPVVSAAAMEHANSSRPFPKAVYHVLLRSNTGFDAKELTDLFPSRAAVSTTRAAPVVDDVIFLQALGLVYLTDDYRWVAREQVPAER